MYSQQSHENKTCEAGAGTISIEKLSEMNAELDDITVSWEYAKGNTRDFLPN